jgi:hypothetical protein
MITSAPSLTIDSALSLLLQSDLEELNRTQSKQLCSIIDSLSDEFKGFLSERVSWPKG